MKAKRKPARKFKTKDKKEVVVQKKTDRSVEEAKDTFDKAVKTKMSEVSFSQGRVIAA